MIEQSHNSTDSHHQIKVSVKVLVAIIVIYLRIDKISGKNLIIRPHCFYGVHFTEILYILPHLFVGVEDILVKPKANIERTKIIEESVTCGAKVK